MTEVDSIMQRCARLGQWDHVVRIGGFRSVEDAKKAMGAVASLRVPVETPEPAPGANIRRRRVEIAQTHRVDKEPRATPGWASQIKQRMWASNYTVKALAQDINRPAVSLCRVLRGEQALTASMRAAIESAIAYAERRQLSEGEA